MNDEVKHNLSIIAKSIASKMLAAGNPNNTAEEQKRSFNQLLAQINSTSDNDAGKKLYLVKFFRMKSNILRNIVVNYIEFLQLKLNF